MTIRAMMADQGEAGAVVATLRMAGVSVSLDAEGDLDVVGKPKAMAAWAALNEAIEVLPKLVAEVLREETGKVEVVIATSNPNPPHDPLARWESIGPGQQAIMEHVVGGGEDPPREVPVAQVTISPPSPGRTKLPRRALVTLVIK
jgi:hypothetical protein